MSDELKLESPPEPGAPRPPRSSWKILLVLATLAVAAIFLLPRESPRRPPAHAPSLPFGPAEAAYAAKLQIHNLALSQAENFLHQEVTTLSCDLVNGGDQAVAAAELTVEFYDPLPQIVLRERRVVVDPSAPPLRAGESRNLEFSFEHIPSSWNRQEPLLRISGLSFVAPGR